MSSVHQRKPKNVKEPKSKEVEREKGEKKKSSATSITSTTSSSATVGNDSTSKVIKILFSIAIGSFLLVAAILFYFLFLNSEVSHSPSSPKPKKVSDRTLTELEILSIVGDELSFSMKASDGSYYDSVKEDHGPEYIKYPWVVDAVPRINWNSKRDFSKVISELGRPVILYNTIVDEWKAKKEWTPAYFMQHTPTFEKVQKHSAPTFSYFHDNHPMSTVPGIDEYKQGTYEVVNMTSAQFFEAIESTPPYHYFAASADNLGTPYNDLYPLEPLMVKNSTWKFEESHLHRWTNAWIGPAGATTHTHYDISHNFYAQLYGKKRFILFPPDDTPLLYLYPFLHPGAQQSQVRFDNPDVQKFPRFSKAKAIEAVLHPGDVLYLPPLWFHHVSALTVSISVSVWTRSPETQTMWKTARSALPFKKSWNENKLALGGRVYLEMLIESLYGKGSTQKFIRELLAQRYEPLYESVPALAPQGKRSYCEAHLLPETRDSILTEMQQVFQEFVMKQAELFASVKTDAKRDIWLGNLCEQLALTVTGKPELVAAYLVAVAEC